MKRGLLLASCTLLCLSILTDASARRTYFSAEQKARLAHADTILVNVLAFTERGRGDAGPLKEVVIRRLREIGYTVVTDRQELHDLEFRVKCEERKAEVRTTEGGGDADHVDNPARLWKGPACLFSYFLNGRDSDWKKEVRTDFEDAYAAAKAANVKKSGGYALAQLKLKLEEYDFPVKLAAELGQDERLLHLLKDPATSKDRKLTILSVMPKLQSHEALSYLKEIQQKQDYSLESVAALTTTGSDGIPLLTRIFSNPAENAAIRAEAAKGLGSIGATTGDHSITPPLLEYLESSLANMKASKDINFPILTEVVWGLGKLRSERSIAPMRKLEKKVWLIYDKSEEMQELREAVNWTIKQIDMDEQAN